MECAHAAGMLVVRLYDGELVPESLVEAWRSTRWRCGFIISGVGMVRGVTLGFFRRNRGYATTTLRGPREVLGVSGNVTLRDGQPFLHLHVTLADGRMRAVGGHLLCACAHVTGEFALVRSTVAFSREVEKTGLPGMKVRSPAVPRFHSKIR
jgi:predicted DNA-binding protein with PD1-like motif